MTWNYRVCKKKSNLPNGEIVYSYTIHEVYYDNDGKITSVTKDPIYPVGESVNELYMDCLHMMEAFKSPVVDLDKLDFSVEE